MKIVEIPSFFPPYGGEFCLEQSKALAMHGHDVTIIANVQLAIRRGLGAYLLTPYGRRSMTVDGIRVYRSDMRGLPVCVKPNVRRWVSIVRSMFREYVETNGKPDILHAHCAKWAGYAACLIAGEYGLPYVITEHLPSMILKEEFGEAPSHAWQIPLLREAYRSADMVIPVSAELVDDIAPYYGKDYRWMEISNTIDTDFFACRERQPLEGRSFRFCCLANFIPRKGYDVLFKAFDLLAGRKAGVELLIAGRFTGDAACREMIETFGSKAKVTVCGELDKSGVRDLLYRCDCLVLSSRSEAQPLVLLEAMSTGIPVISTACAPRSLCRLSGCTIVPIDDVMALSEAMFNAASEARTDGKRISDEVAAMASPAAVGKKLEDVFHGIIYKGKANN